MGLKFNIYIKSYIFRINFNEILVWYFYNLGKLVLKKDLIEL